MDFVEIVNVSLDLSTIYFIFLILVDAELPSVQLVYSIILECYNLFSGVKLSISVLFYFVNNRFRDYNN